MSKRLEVKSRKLEKHLRGRGYHCVYVLGCTSSKRVAKIGIARDVASRLSDIQVGNWKKLYVFRYWWAENARLSEYIEKSVHKTLKKSVISGEWFRERPEFVATVVEEEAKERAVTLWADDGLDSVIDAFNLALPQPEEKVL